MIELPIHQHQIDLAREREKALPSTLANSIRRGEGIFIGLLGEILYCDAVEGTYLGTYQHDLIVNGNRMEVKTKERTVAPLWYYNCTVSAANTRQDCDYYVFMSILDDLTKGWYLGYISKSDFFKKARFTGHDTLDVVGSSYHFRTDCYNIKICDLIST